MLTIRLAAAQAPRAQVGEYIVRNVSFESPAAAGAEEENGVDVMAALRKEAGMVWAEDNMQFFNFHNELAYMDVSPPAHSIRKVPACRGCAYVCDGRLGGSQADRHAALGCAKYAFFCCTDPPDAGGYTILSGETFAKEINEICQMDPQSDCSCARCSLKVSCV